jgi:large subunit ribosomal protein L13
MELNDKVYHVFNAERIPYGLMINDIAKILNGKHKPTYRQNEAPGDTDQVLVLNATKIFMRGNKMQNYHLRYHSGYVGNLKTKYYRNLAFEKPEMLIEYSVRRMLPKNWLSEDKIVNLTVYRD